MPEGGQIFDRAPALACSSMFLRAGFVFPSGGHAAVLNLPSVEWASGMGGAEKERKASLLRMVYSYRAAADAKTAGAKTAAATAAGALSARTLYSGEPLPPEMLDGMRVLTLGAPELAAGDEAIGRALRERQPLSAAHESRARGALMKVLAQEAERYAEPRLGLELLPEPRRSRWALFNSRGRDLFREALEQLTDESQ